MNQDSYARRAIEAHAAWRGKIEVTPRVGVATREDLSIA